MIHRLLSVVILTAAYSPSVIAPPLITRAHAAPAPEIEYTYDVTVRRHYNFPSNDAIGYGRQICDKVSAGEGYSQIMGDVKRDVSPNDEFATNYLVSNAVNILCPEGLWQLRNSAANYQAAPTILVIGSTTLSKDGNESHYR